MFDPLLFANWRSIARGLTLVCWLVVLVLVCVIGSHLGHPGPSGHVTRHVVPLH